MVGENGWVLVTADKQMRYNLLERRALGQSKVREFVFASGNMSGKEMAAAIELSVGRIRRFCERLEPPFVATITRKGEIHLRWPKTSRE